MIGYAGGPDGYAPEEITFWWVAIVMGVGVLIVEKDTDTKKD